MDVANQTEFYEERAAIRQFCGNMTKQRAESAAHMDLWQRTHQPQNQKEKHHDISHRRD